MKDASDSCDESPGQPCHQSPPRLTPNERFAARQAIPLRRTLTRGIAMRHHLLLASGLALLLAACGDRQPEQPATTAEATPAAAPTSIEDVELIPRDALFGNPERANVQLSPDGKYLSWIEIGRAPVELQSIMRN